MLLLSKWRALIRLGYAVAGLLSVQGHAIAATTKPFYEVTQKADGDATQYKFLVDGEMDAYKADFIFKRQFAENLSLDWNIRSNVVDQKTSAFDEVATTDRLRLQNTANIKLNWQVSPLFSAQVVNREQQALALGATVSQRESWTAVETTSKFGQSTSLATQVGSGRSLDNTSTAMARDKVQLKLMQKLFGERAKLDITPSFTKEFDPSESGSIYGIPALESMVGVQLTNNWTWSSGTLWEQRRKVGDVEAWTTQQVKSGLGYHADDFWAIQVESGLKQETASNYSSMDTLFTRSAVTFSPKKYVDLRVETGFNNQINHPTGVDNPYSTRQIEFKFSPTYRDFHGFDTKLDLQYNFNGDNDGSWKPAESSLYFSVGREF
ncbi:MAG: hypothetical protein SFY80_00625 [Verrucomicrobiota bacterium]|nr:hypothetical protein [Verrucomicrobiota bacterium]